MEQGRFGRRTETVPRVRRQYHLAHVAGEQDCRAAGHHGRHASSTSTPLFGFQVDLDSEHGIGTCRLGLRPQLAQRHGTGRLGLDRIIRGPLGQRERRGCLDTREGCTDEPILLHDLDASSARHIERTHICAKTRRTNSSRHAVWHAVQLWLTDVEVRSFLQVNCVRCPGFGGSVAVDRNINVSWAALVAPRLLRGTRYQRRPPCRHTKKCPPYDRIQHTKGNSPLQPAGCRQAGLGWPLAWPLGRLLSPLGCFVCGGVILFFRALRFGVPLAPRRAPAGGRFPPIHAIPHQTLNTTADSFRAALAKRAFFRTAVQPPATSSRSSVSRAVARPGCAGGGDGRRRHPDG